MDLSNDFSLYKIHLDDCFDIPNLFLIVRSVHSETMNDLIWEKDLYKKIPIFLSVER